MTEIRDEPTVGRKQVEPIDLPATKVARMKNAFGCISNDNPAGATAHLEKLTADELRELMYYTNWLFRLAEGVYMSRATRKGQRE